MAYTTNVAAEDNLQQIFDSLPENAVVRLAPGEYRQKTVIRTPEVMKAAAEREEAERLKREKEEAEKKEAERLAKEKAAAEKAAKAKAEEERKAKERAEQAEKRAQKRAEMNSAERRQSMLEAGKKLDSKIARQTGQTTAPKPEGQPRRDRRGPSKNRGPKGAEFDRAPIKPAPKPVIEQGVEKKRTGAFPGGCPQDRADPIPRKNKRRSAREES